ncbi:MAG: helix-turn-helix transcriptional regulator [Candidatus Odinarchaeota archaeon]
MTYFLPKRNRLGWLQLTILTLLWNRELYGLEIQKYLKLGGYKKIGVSQLYPALNRMKDEKLLNSRLENQIGADRRYYWTTEKGKDVVIQYLSNFFVLFEDLFIARLDFLADHINELVNLGEQGLRIADFSLGTANSGIFLRETLANLDLIKDYFMLASNEKMRELLETRIEFLQLKRVINILEVKKNEIPLEDETIDLVLILFTLHEDDTEWLIAETSRVLKKEGKALFIDFIGVEKENILLDILTELFPFHSNIGVVPKIIIEQIQRYDLELIEQREYKGLVYLLAKKNTFGLA